MARPDDPSEPPATAVAVPRRRSRLGTALGVALTLVAVGVALAFGLSRADDPGELVVATAVAQGGEVEAPPAEGAVPPAFAAAAGAAGWTPVGSRADTVEGRGLTTVFWGRQGRRVAVTVLPGDPAGPPPGARRTGRRGLLLHSFDAGPRTAVTWTEGGRTVVASSIGVERDELYDLAGGPAAAP